MNSSSSRRALPARSKLGGLAVVALLGAYSLLAPLVNDRLGWDLPALTADQTGGGRVLDAAAADSSPTGREPAGSQHNLPSLGGTQPTSRPPSRDRPDEAPATAASDQQPGDTLFGLLREVSRDRYISPAGLVYAPGGAEGHRLEHLRRHTQDDPRRPGSHGVFDGEMEGALKTIDLAYRRAKQNQRTTKRVDQGRIIYTVDMGSRVGFVGGQDGNRRRKPMARRVRLVLEGNRVITAYPL